MQQPWLNFTLFLSILFFSSCQDKAKFAYPDSKKVNQTDDYYGVAVQDPYRWLESDSSADVKHWVEEQNRFTNNYLEKVPYRNKIRQRIMEIANFPKYGIPVKVGNAYIYSKNDGLQDHAVFYIQDCLGCKSTVLLDPNALNKDGSVSVGISGISKNKQFVVMSISRSGSDWNQLMILDLKSKSFLKDTLHWVKFSGAAWFGSGFFYSRYPEPKDGKENSSQNINHKVYYHKLNTSQDKDILIYENLEKPFRYRIPHTTEDERFLIISISEGTYGNRILVKDLTKKDSKLTEIFEGFKYEYSIIDNEGDKLIVQTNNGANNGRVILVDPLHPEAANWKTLIPEQKNPLTEITSAGNKLFAVYMQDVTSKIYQYSYDGVLENQIELPALGKASGFFGNFDDNDVFYSFTSFVYPSTIFRYNIAEKKSYEYWKSEAKFNPVDYETNQVFYKSKDGTMVPMFVVHKKNMRLDGNNPTLLYGYGGFNNSMQPTFSSSRIVFLENGGVYALANIRGGGEYGEEWHKAGILEKKQNVFDDFIAAAEYLVNEKYTNPELLACQGGSNGGLLVGAVINQRPDLFKVALPSVGVMDMLRFHLFTMGWGWMVEYGSSDKKEQFDYLYKYSPLHNIKSQNYPAVLITTADHDFRVKPAHSFKYTAALQANQAGSNPILIRIETNAGPGDGKPLLKMIDEQADIYSFLFYNFGVEPSY